MQNILGEHMRQYIDLIRDILYKGSTVYGRNGKTTRVFGRQIEFDIDKGFPIQTTRKVHFNAVLHELIGFMNGDDTYIRTNTKIWDKWEGRLPYTHLANISKLIEEAKANPESRRLLLAHWNNDWVSNKLGCYALPTCHDSFQINITGGKVDLIWRQRSVDVVCGLPFNIASYATLLQIIALHLDLKPGKVIGQLGDVHIYENHMDVVSEMLKREPFPLPVLKITKEDNIMDYTLNNFELCCYEHHDYIKAEVVS